MEAKVLCDILLRILRFALNETEPDDAIKEQLTPEVLPALYTLSKKHDLAHIAARFLRQNGLLSDEMLEKFNKEEVVSVFRQEALERAYIQICQIFDEAKIAYVPLKGSVIRPYYPGQYMRTSCDIDILVHKEDLDTAVEALISKGYKCGTRDYHDVSLFSPSKVHLELHFSILENTENLDLLLKDAWQYAVLSERSRYEFSKEFFLFHMYAHMSYHFLSGGCGVRSLMDIWVMKHKMNIDYTEAKYLLKKAGIYQFAKELGNLAEVCFSGKPQGDFAEMLLAYIFSGGVYGTIENNIAINNSKTHLTFSYMCHRIFIPYKDLTLEYPVLKKMPILLPLCWLLRTLRLFWKLLTRTFNRIKTRGRISDEKIDRAQQMRSRMGL